MKTTVRPLSILYFTNSRQRGGAEEHLVSLIGKLDRSAFQPILACPRVLADQMQTDLGRGVELWPVELRRPFDWREALRLGRLMRLRQIDILHSHLFSSSVFASPIGRLAGVPAIVETPHVSERWRRGWLKGHFVADRLIARLVDAFIAVSHANARYLIDEKGLRPEKVRVISNGIDTRRFAAAHRPAALMRLSLGFRPDDPLLVCIARLEPQKGHAVLLDAMARIRAEVPRARLLIVGEGSLRQSLESRTRALNLGETVRFVGRQTNVPDWLALAQVAVLPSFYEGLPLAALEALAAQKPLVATAVDGTPEVVLDGRTGFTVPPGDAPSLAAAILRMLRDPAHARKMAAAGRRLITEKYSHERQVRDTETLYREIWEKRATRCAFTQAVEIPAHSHWRRETS